MTSNGDDFASITPRLYVPLLAPENGGNDLLSETISVISYLADQSPEAGLIQAQGTLECAKSNGPLYLPGDRDRPEAHPADAQADE